MSFNLEVEDLNLPITPRDEFCLGHLVMLTLALIDAAKVDADSWEQQHPTRAWLGVTLADAHRDGSWPEHLEDLFVMVAKILLADNPPSAQAALQLRQQRRGHARPMARNNVVRRRRRRA